MKHLLALLVLFAPALAVASAEAGAEAPGASRPTGVVLGVGYGVHSYFDAGLSEQDDGASDRDFDGSYLQAHVGYLLPSGGFLALDWAGYSGSNSVLTERSELTLAVRTQTVSAAAGFAYGSRVRLHLEGLVGIAFGRFERRLQTGTVVTSHASATQALALGAEAGLDVLPTDWLSIGARGRVGITAGSDDAGVDLGGVFLGLTASVIL